MHNASRSALATRDYPVIRLAEPLVTERLAIRLIQADDAADYHAIFGNPAVCRYDDFPPISPEQAVHDINGILEGYAEDAEELEYAVALGGSHRVIGVLCTRAEPEGIYLGYHFNESYHGQGFACEAVRALCRWLESSGAPLLYAAVNPANQRSVQLLEKLGFILVDERMIPSTDALEPEHIFRYQPAHR